MLEVLGLTKRYGDNTALSAVTVAIEPGEILGLLGPNGAGKTTLVSIVAGLRRADAGTVRVCGVDVAVDPSGARRCLGLAPQELGIYPILTVEENLRFFAEVAGLRSRALRQRIAEVAEALDIAQFLERQARFLSGGEKRRVHTAIAMVHRPSLLLLDEPTTGVDVQTRAHLIEVVRGLAADGAAVCYSTHYLPEVEALGASVAILERGELIARGPVQELVRSHGHAALELTFEGPLPPTEVVAKLHGETRDGRIRVYAEQPAMEAAGVLAALGGHAGRLRSIDVVTPSLEAVFLSLTGRRYDDQDGSSPEEPAHQDGERVAVS
jgi:ABC-2 type transport system ATP-binding protein